MAHPPVHDACLNVSHCICSFLIILSDNKKGKFAIDSAVESRLKGMASKYGPLLRVQFGADDKDVVRIERFAAQGVLTKKNK